MIFWLICSKHYDELEEELDDDMKRRTMHLSSTDAALDASARAEMRQRESSGQVIYSSCLLFGLLIITVRRQVTPGQLRLANAYYACMQHEHPAMNPPRLHCILSISLFLSMARRCCHTLLGLWRDEAFLGAGAGQAGGRQPGGHKRLAVHAQPGRLWHFRGLCGAVCAVWPGKAGAA